MEETIWTPDRDCRVDIHMGLLKTRNVRAQEGIQYSLYIYLLLRFWGAGGGENGVEIVICLLNCTRSGLVVLYSILNAICYMIVLCFHNTGSTFDTFVYLILII